MNDSSITRAEPDAWGLRASRTHRLQHRFRRAVTTARRSLLISVTAVLGLGGIALAGANYATAGIGNELACSMVSTTEPSARPGAGPAAWFPNRNMAEITPPGSDAPPRWMNQLTHFPAGSNGSVDQYTLYEVAGLRGLSWWVMTENAQGEQSCSVSTYLWTQVANFMFMMDRNLLQVVIALKELASTDQPLAFLYDASSGAISGLFAGFFVPMAMVLVTATGIWMAIQALKSGGQGLRAALGGLLAALVVVAMGAAIYAEGARGFRQIAATADKAVSSMTGMATSAMYQAVSTNPRGLCDLPPSGTFTDEYGQRITSCVLAKNLAYLPWAVGQFGAAGREPIKLPKDVDVTYPNEEFNHDPGTLPCYVRYNNCRELRSYLIAQHGGPTKIGEYDMSKLKDACLAVDRRPFPNQVTDRGDDSETDRVACSPTWAVWHLIKNEKVGDSAMLSAYRGEGALNRIGQSFTAFLGIVVVGIGVAVVAVITLVWHVMTFTLFMIGPFRLVQATYAGKFKVMQEWLGELVGTWFARLAYGIALALMILVTSWMFQSALPLGMQLVFLAILLFGFWKLVAKIQQELTPSSSSTTPDIAGGVQSAMKGTALGAGAVAGVATMSGGRAMHGGARGGARELRRKTAAVHSGEMSKRQALRNAPWSVVSRAAQGAGEGAFNTSGYRYDRFFGGASKTSASGGDGATASGPRSKWNKARTTAGQWQREDQQKQSANGSSGSGNNSGKPRRKTTASSNGTQGTQKTSRSSDSESSDSSSSTKVHRYSDHIKNTSSKDDTDPPKRKKTDE